MGDEVADTIFSREDRQRYRDKVKRCLDVFARMLAESRSTPTAARSGWRSSSTSPRRPATRRWRTRTCSS